MSASWTVDDLRASPQLRLLYLQAPLHQQEGWRVVQSFNDEYVLQTAYVTSERGQLVNDELVGVGFQSVTALRHAVYELTGVPAHCRQLSAYMLPDGSRLFGWLVDPRRAQRRWQWVNVTGIEADYMYMSRAAALDAVNGLPATASV